MPLRVYIETTIPSAYFERRSGPEMVARRNWIRPWWDQHRHKFEPVTSAAVFAELERGDHPDKADKASLLLPLAVLPITAEVDQITEVYMQRFLMSRAVAGDAHHLALTSHFKCDILLTWNCQHFANYSKREHLGRVNAILGICVPALITPLELLGNDFAK